MLEIIAAGHDEKYSIRQQDRDKLALELPFQDFFSGRRFPDKENAAIIIGDPISKDPPLRIEHVFLLEYEETIKDESDVTSTTLRRKILSKSDAARLPQVDGRVRQALRVFKADYISLVIFDIDRPRRVIHEITGGLPCSFVPTQFVSRSDLARLWDQIALTELEPIVSQALRCITPEFEALAFVESENIYYNTSSSRETQRIPKVKISGFSRPVPLNSLGDGMSRVLQMILHVFPAKDGFLIIDEFENGLHYSVQESMWSLIFDLAE